MNERNRRDDSQMIENIHKDVHGIRGELLGAIEKSHTALLNGISLLDAKLTNLSNGITAEDLARMDALKKEGARLVTVLKGLNAQT